MFLISETINLRLKSRHNIIEFMVSKSSDERFYSEKQLHEIADEIDRAVTIPVSTMIEAEHRVYDLSEMEKILREANRITVQDCGCRTEYRNCDSPRDVCLGLDEEADVALKGKYNARVVTIDEALDVLRRSHEAGLVHMAYVMEGYEKPGLVCSCCPCCCHTLGGLLRYGIHTQVLTSSLIAIDDHEKCNACGTCTSRCVFGARNLVEGELIYDSTKCYGCGLCVSTCPTQTISMIPRAQ